MKARVQSLSTPAHSFQPPNPSCNGKSAISFPRWSTAWSAFAGNKGGGGGAQQPGGCSCPDQGRVSAHGVLHAAWL
eukprot:8413162-Alexandrium_andersonii.AAC.1